MYFSELFPTLVGHSDQSNLVNETLELAKEYLSDDNKIFKDWAYRTTYSYPANDLVDPRLKNFCDVIRNSCSEWLNLNKFPPHPIKNINIFFNEIKENQCHPRHSHPNCHLSGVFYLSTPEGSGDFCFIDPKPSFNVLDLSGGKYLGRFRIKPSVGLFTLFPSWLEHEVEHSSCNEPRISAPFNVVFDL